MDNSQMHMPTYIKLNGGSQHPERLLSPSQLGYSKAATGENAEEYSILHNRTGDNKEKLGGIMAQ
jgi:hypothetical protein